jgi:proline dehydrogenase
MNIINKLVVFFMPIVPKFIIQFFSKKYIAGAKVEDALKVIKDLNAKGIMATIDVLGEEIKEKREAEEAVQQYLQILKIIKNEKLDSNISVKPTHMGLKLDKEFCYNNVKILVEEAKKHNNFVRIDMEDHTCTDDTIEIYLRLRKEYDNVGTVLQSYMRRNIDDINYLIPHKANLRLCKGIYVEPKAVAYKDKEIVNNNFSYCLEKLLANKCYVGIATHDEKLVWNALAIIDKLKLKKEEYEFQMLLGVTEDLRDIIVNAGHRMRVYVPFGEQWYAYSTRRLKENPNMAGYIIKSILHLD